MDYTGLGMSGAMMFFPIIAILSVPLAAASLTYCLRGMANSTGERYDQYLRLFKTIAIVNAVFIPAVIMYRWLVTSNTYEVLYHFVGYFGNIVFFFQANGYLRKDGIKARSEFAASLMVSLGYLFVAAGISAALGVSSSGSIFAGESRVNVFSWLLGCGYASLQAVIPYMYYKQGMVDRAVKRNTVQPVSAAPYAPAAPLSASGVEQLPIQSANIEDTAAPSEIEGATVPDQAPAPNSDENSPNGN